jgi:regulator of protease activity HflC (stomatin/prohibitin superfamily)
MNAKNYSKVQDAHGGAERHPQNAKQAELNAMMADPPMVQQHYEVDLDQIDQSIYNDYDNARVYQKEKEAGCFKSCYNFCGDIPKYLCVCCSPCGCGPIYKIYQGSVGIKIRHGRLQEKMAPGLHVVNSCADVVKIVDLRQTALEVGYYYITRDNLTVAIKAFGVWKVTNPEVFVFKVDNKVLLTDFILKGVVCSLTSKFTLDELMQERSNLEKVALNLMNSKVKTFGMAFLSMEFNEINLPQEITSAISALALAKRSSKAKLIQAKGEINSASMYKEAADQVTKNPISLQLQYMEVMKEIAKESHSTLIMPDSCIGSWANLKFDNSSRGYAKGNNESYAAGGRSSKKNSHRNSQDDWDFMDGRKKSKKSFVDDDDEGKERKKKKKDKKKRKKKRKKTKRDDGDSDGRDGIDLLGEL